MIKSTFKRFYARCTTFSARTSFHGFNELFTTKQVLGKIFWIFCLTICVSVAIYQLVSTCHQYMNDSYIRVVEEIKADEMLYENVSLCFPHWVTWADFKKAQKMNFTKESLHYGLSYLGSVYADFDFDIAEAGKQFFATMEMHNMSRVLEFVRAIAKKSPDEQFSEISLNYDTLCYVAHSQKLIKRIYKAKTEDVELSFMINLHEFYDQTFQYLSIKEYNCNILKIFYSSYVIPDDFNDELAPMAHMPATLKCKDSMIPLEPDDLLLQISLSATARQLQNRKSSPCSPSSGETLKECKNKCDFHNNLFHRCVCHPLEWDTSRLGYDEIVGTCRREIKIFNSSNKCKNIDMADMRPVLPANFKNLNCTNGFNPLKLCCNEISSKFNVEKCRSECFKPCTKWDYEFGSIFKLEPNKNHLNFKALKQIATYVTVKFPSPSKVLFTNEIENRSVEKLFGNIGGILGIWLGGSVVSFLQLFYICCFNEFIIGKNVKNRKNFQTIKAFRQPYLIDGSMRA